MKFKVFISSVQREFAEERQKLAEYIRKDALNAKPKALPHHNTDQMPRFSTRLSGGKRMKEQMPIEKTSQSG